MGSLRRPISSFSSVHLISLSAERNHPAFGVTFSLKTDSKRRVVCSAGRPTPGVAKLRRSNRFAGFWRTLEPENRPLTSARIPRGVAPPRTGPERDLPLQNLASYVESNGVPASIKQRASPGRPRESHTWRRTSWRLSYCESRRSSERHRPPGGQKARLRDFVWVKVTPPSAPAARA